MLKLLIATVAAAFLAAAPAAASPETDFMAKIGYQCEQASAWCPVVKPVMVGDRFMFQVVDWVGAGPLPKPAVGQYMAEGGWTSDPASAQSIDKEGLRAQVKEVLDILMEGLK